MSGQDAQPTWGPGLPLTRHGWMGAGTWCATAWRTTSPPRSASRSSSAASWASTASSTSVPSCPAGSTVPPSRCDGALPLQAAPLPAALCRHRPAPDQQELHARELERSPSSSRDQCRFTRSRGLGRSYGVLAPPHRLSQWWRFPVSFGRTPWRAGPAAGQHPGLYRVRLLLQLVRSAAAGPAGRHRGLHRRCRAHLGRQVC